jgi:tyrosyl-tRNA synthetase
MSRLSQSVAAVSALVARADLAGDGDLRELLGLTTERRSLDLSDLSPVEQAELIAGRSAQVVPGADALADRVKAAESKQRSFVAKLGIDPTGAEVHLGHAVPMLILSRLQRMGHQVVLIVGDVTAKIGDPSGRSDERPALTDGEIAANLATYRTQVSPFFDFERAQLRHNGDWLAGVTLPRLIEVTSKIPVSMSLQREDFRTRLAAGTGLSVAELLYSVAMALDSVEVACDVEIGGIDQLLNMGMCRKVMEICGQAPEVVVATPLIEGTDGTGAKMSKSRGNYVALGAPPGEVFGQVMSIPDRLVTPWFAALSEWSDPELALLGGRVESGVLHPMERKRVLACEVTAALHGVDAAMQARLEFAAQFSHRVFGGLDDLPSVTDLEDSVLQALRRLGWAKSNGEVRRLAGQTAVRLVVQAGGEGEQLTLSVEEVLEPIGTVVRRRLGGRSGECYLKVGRKLARVRRDS